MLFLKTIGDACQPGVEKQEEMAFPFSLKGRQNRVVQGIDRFLLGTHDKMSCFDVYSFPVL